jgi:hypothetical protein
MKTTIPIILIAAAILTIGMAGDWMVDTVSVSHHLDQTEAAATNTVMGALGIGTAAPAAKLHVAGSAILEGSLNMQSNRVTHLADPQADGDAVNQQHLMAVLANIEPASGLSMGIYTNR